LCDCFITNQAIAKRIRIFAVLATISGFSDVLNGKMLVDFDLGFAGLPEQEERCLHVYRGSFDLAR
jgi:hypothetical protein